MKIVLNVYKYYSAMVLCNGCVSRCANHKRTLERFLSKRY